MVFIQNYSCLKENSYFKMQIYKVRLVRKVIVKFRAYFMVYILRKLKTIESKDAFGVTVKHNLKSLFQCNDRIKLLINPLSSIERIDKDSKILIIGPRNENDLYLLNSEGVKMSNITGLDLISYSKRIQLGDMHKMNFEDSSFDAVIFGWTLSYSSAPQKAIDEIVRVTKPNGIVAVGVEYGGMGKEDSEELLGYSIQEYDKLDERINSTNQIIDLFGANSKHIYFNHDAPLRQFHSSIKLNRKVSNVAVIVEIAK